MINVINERANYLSIYCVVSTLAFNKQNNKRTKNNRPFLFIELDRFLLEQESAPDVLVITESLTICVRNIRRRIVVWIHTTSSLACLRNDHALKLYRPENLLPSHRIGPIGRFLGAIGRCQNEKIVSSWLELYSRSELRKSERSEENSSSLSVLARFPSQLFCL